MCTDETTMSVYISHMNPLQSTMWPWTLVYISHYWHRLLNKYVSCITHIHPNAQLLLATCRSHITRHTSPKNPKQTTAPIYHVINLYAAATNMPFKCHLHQLLSVQIWGNYVHIYTSNELTAMNNATWKTGIHIFHITGLCFLTDMSAPCICVTLHLYCKLHTDPTLLHTSSKNK